MICVCASGKKLYRSRCANTNVLPMPIGLPAIASLCRAENKVSLGFAEGLNNKARVIQHHAYGLSDEEYLKLKILTCMLPDL